MSNGELDVLFQEEDFHQERFDDAEFVAKYRKVITLESLREQLLTYSHSVRQELYAIINRDYKDFITISTKLDGLDTRLELIQKPLFDLQINVTSLHNVVTSSLRTIKDKVRQRLLLVEQKTKVKCILLAIENLKVAQSCLSSLSVSSSSTTDEGSIGRIQHRDEESSFELFSCSEYERAAAAISVGLRSLQSVDASKISELGVALNHREIFDELVRLKASLQEKMSSRLETMFSNASKTTRVSIPSPEQSWQLSTDCRSFLHCVRGLLFLQSGHLVEEAFMRSVMDPFVKTSFTFGKIDGREGRGSFSGLEETLNQLLETLEKSELPKYFQILEIPALFMISPNFGVFLDQNSLPVDLIVKGVWNSVAQALIDRFSGVFSVGITQIFSKCFLAIQKFLERLPKALVTDDNHAVVGKRLRLCETNRKLAQMWKLDIYSQLRVREVSQRLERLCEASLEERFRLPFTNKPSTFTTLQSLIQQQYSSVLERNRVSSGSSSPTSNPLQIDTSELESIYNAFDHLATVAGQSRSFFNDIFAGFVLELLIVMNFSVALPPCLAKFLVFADRIVQRLMIHLCCIIVSESSAALASYVFKMKKSDLEGLRLSNTSTAAVNTTVDEQILITADLLQFYSWYQLDYLQYVQSMVCRDHRQVINGDQVAANVSRVFESSFLCVRLFLRAFLHQIVQDIVHECCKPLSNVKAIAGKYRMTNKPAPSAASPYVSAIFAPLKKIMGSYAVVLTSMVERIGLYEDTSQSIEEIISTLSDCQLSPSQTIDTLIVKVIQQVSKVFYENLVSLLGTVRQMDSALQRRAIAAKSQTSNPNLSDSEKISMQLKLDVESYGQEINALGISDLLSIPSIALLQQEIGKLEFSK